MKFYFRHNDALVNNEMHTHLPWSSSIGQYKIAHTNLPISLDYIPAKWGVQSVHAIHISRSLAASITRLAWNHNV